MGQKSAERICGELQVIAGEDNLRRMVEALQAVIRFKTSLKKRLLDPNARRKMKKAKPDAAMLAKMKQEKEERQAREAEELRKRAEAERLRKEEEERQREKLEE